MGSTHKILRLDRGSSSEPSMGKNQCLCSLHSFLILWVTFQQEMMFNKFTSFLSYIIRPLQLMKWVTTWNL